jgi:hypothetical protein
MRSLLLRIMLLVLTGTVYCCPTARRVSTGVNKAAAVIGARAD